jgi:flagellar L-ring protein precursor FlgH
MASAAQVALAAQAVEFEMRIDLFFLAAMTATGCGPNHIGPFTPRQRAYAPGAYAQRDPAAKPSKGSLFSEAGGGYLEDTRAVRVGDVVVIKVDEAADAQGNSTTKLSKDNSGSLGIDSLFGLMPALKKAHPDIDPSKLLAFAAQSGFTGDGNTQRRGTLTASIAVRVAKEMPNGDLFLEGTKVIMINNEEYHLYVSGLARPADINQDNAVASSRLADAQIEFTGVGDIADQQRKGILSRAVDTINPL